MPTIAENLAAWSEFPPQRYDDYFSRGWRGVELLWWGTLWPRIHLFLPVPTILEIGPGSGRCTHFLQGLCDRLIVVDVNSECVADCQRRFASCHHITYAANDGKSLHMVPDRSVDFAFSYDTLVHADADVIDAYLAELARTLRPDGVAFLHHSNIGQYVHARTGRLAFYVQNKYGSNWRSTDMTAERFRALCHKAGLQCVSQEVVVSYPEDSVRASHTFHGRLRAVTRHVIERHVRLLNDCFSLVTHRESRWARPTRVYVNRTFWDDVNKLAKLSELYTRSSFEHACAAPQQPLPAHSGVAPAH